MGEFRKFFFHLVRGFFWHWIQCSSSKSGQEIRGIQTRIPPGGALLSPLRRHWEKYRLEIRKKRRKGRFVISTFIVQSFYP